jgi:hypothetical protein
MRSHARPLILSARQGPGAHPAPLSRGDDRAFAEGICDVYRGCPWSSGGVLAFGRPGPAANHLAAVRLGIHHPRLADRSGSSPRSANAAGRLLHVRPAANPRGAFCTFVDRDGESRFHVANVKAKTLREKIVTTVSRKSHLMTDELASYEKIGKEFANHGTVNHSANEFAKLGGFTHTNTAECRFSLMKRAVFGTHHSISEAHLPRYLTEWDFKWNTRKMTDGKRAAIALKGAEGKRLTYRQPREATHSKRREHSSSGGRILRRISKPYMARRV